MGSLPDGNVKKSALRKCFMRRGTLIADVTQRHRARSQSEMQTEPSFIPAAVLQFTAEAAQPQVSFNISVVVGEISSV